MAGYSDAIGRPISTSEIRRTALTLRHILCIENEPAPNMVWILEHLLPEIIDDFIFKVEPRGVLKGDGALTDWAPCSIALDENVYNNACKEQGRARFTIAHEIGHVILHPGYTQARHI